MDTEKKMRFGDAWKIQLRAMKDIHRLDRWLLPSIALEKIVSAITPFVLIYFSARILNELAGARRADMLWKWVWLSVAASGLLALLKAILARWKGLHEGLIHSRRPTLFVKKLFEMDFADMDKPATHDLRAQIQQNEQWMGRGLPVVPRIFSGIVESTAGIISAVVLTTSLFLAKVPSSAGNMTVLNHPLFVLAILASMLLLSTLSGKLHGHADMLEAALADKARLGNRIFGYFGFFGADKRDVDIRMYNQNSIVRQYFPRSDDPFGTNGPFAKLTRGRGGVYHGIAASLSAVFTGTIYIFTCLKALSGAFGVGLITQYVGAATALSGSLTKLFSTLGEIQNNGKFLALCYDFLDIPNSMYQGSLTTEKRNDREYHVEFRDVSFRYPGTDT